MSKRTDEAMELAICALFIVAVIALCLFRAQAPCSWMGWVPAAELPGRCVMR